LDTKNKLHHSHHVKQQLLKLHVSPCTSKH